MGSTRGPGLPVVVCRAGAVRRSSTKVIVIDPTRRAGSLPPDLAGVGTGAEADGLPDPWEEGDAITLVAGDEQATLSSAIAIEHDAAVRRVIDLLLQRQR